MDRRTRLTNKLNRNPAAILGPDEVTLLVAEAGRMLGPRFSELAATRSALFEDLVRWSSLKARCEQARTMREIDIKAAAVQAGIPRYRAAAIENGRLREIVPALAWRYFAFLGIRAWVRKWARANTDLAMRARIATGRRDVTDGGRKSNNSVNLTDSSCHGPCLRTARAKPARRLR